MIENIKFGKQERELEKRKKGTGIKTQLSEFWQKYFNCNYIQ